MARDCPEIARAKNPQRRLEKQTKQFSSVLWVAGRELLPPVLYLAFPLPLRDAIHPLWQPLYLPDRSVQPSWTPRKGGAMVHVYSCN